MRPLRIPRIEEFADPLHLVEDLPRPVLHRHFAAISSQKKPGFASTPRDGDMVAIEHALLGGIDQRTFAHQAERHERFEEAQRTLLDAHRIEGIDIERAHLDILDATAQQRLGGALAGARHPLGADEGVVLVLDLQQVGVELTVYAINLHAEPLVLGVRRADGARQVAHIILQAVHRDLDARLVAVAVTEIAHAQRGRMGFPRGATAELRQHFAARP